MRDPPRWKDLGSEIEPELRDLMSELAKPPPIDAEILSRIGGRIGSIGGAVASLSIATKAILAAAMAGAIAAGVLKEEEPRPELPMPLRAIPERPAEVRLTPKPVLVRPKPRKLADPSTLSEEARLLLDARKRMALAPDEAGALLELHEKRFPQGVLQEEREVLRLELASALGRTEEIEARARAILRRFPTSAHRDRVEALRRRR